MNQSQIIGTKIKKQRLYHKMTLKQLSDATGLSIGYLSQVERGLGTLSLPALENLSNILHIEMSSFFEQEKEENSDLIVYSHQREKLQVSNQFLHYSLSRQCSEIQPVIYEIYPSHEEQKSEETMLFGHPEEEYLYILEGVCLLTIDDQEYTLNPSILETVPISHRIPDISGKIRLPECCVFSESQTDAHPSHLWQIRTKKEIFSCQRFPLILPLGTVKNIFTTTSTLFPAAMA